MTGLGPGSLLPLKEAYCDEGPGTIELTILSEVFATGELAPIHLTYTFEP